MISAIMLVSMVAGEGDVRCAIFAARETSYQARCPVSRKRDTGQPRHPVQDDMFQAGCMSACWPFFQENGQMRRGFATPHRRFALMERRSRGAGVASVVLCGRVADDGAQVSVPVRFGGAALVVLLVGGDSLRTAVLEDVGKSVERRGRVVGLPISSAVGVLVVPVTAAAGLVRRTIDGEIDEQGLRRVDLGHGEGRIVAGPGCDGGVEAAGNLAVAGAIADEAHLVHVSVAIEDELDVRGGAAKSVGEIVGA